MILPVPAANPYSDCCCHVLFFLTATYMSFLVLLYRFVFPFFFLFYTNYLGIVIFRFYCVWRSFVSTPRLCLSLVQFTSRKFVSFIQIVKIIIIINATKTHASTLWRARLCVRNESCIKRFLEDLSIISRWCSNCP